MFRFTVVRRCVTIPAFLGAWAIVLVAAPILVPACLAGDLIRRTRRAWTRAYLMLLVYLSCEAAGIAASGWLWVSRGRDHSAFLERNFRLQCWWAMSQFRAGVWLYGLRLDVRGTQFAASGPIILLVRHVSVFDNLLPAVLLSDPYHLRLRWVMNRRLLRDPCLDLVGNRLPNCFVQGGSNDADGEIAKVALLARDLGPGEGVVIYPEGALFSRSKRTEVVQSLRRRGMSEAAGRAEAFQNLLPPRPAGTLALLDHAPHADVVICAHAGLDRAATRTDILGGALIGATLTIEFERFARASIPVDRFERERWLYERWRALDDWVARVGSLPHSVIKGSGSR